MALAARSLDLDLPKCSLGGRDEVYRVEQIKYGLDKTSPWWRRLFFRAIFLPVNRYARKLGIPALGALEPEPAKCPTCGADVPGERFSWVEDQGTFTETDNARAACQAEFWRVRKSPLNVELPAASCEFACAEYPKGSRRFRHGKTMGLALKPIEEIQGESHNVTAAIEQVDRLREKVKAASV